MFDLITSTGIPFTYTVRIPDRAVMQIVEFIIESPYTEGDDVLTTNVASLATLGISVEQTLVEHVEYLERVAAKRSAGED